MHSGRRFSRIGLMHYNSLGFIALLHKRDNELSGHDGVHTPKILSIFNVINGIITMTYMKIFCSFFLQNVEKKVPHIISRAECSLTTYDWVNCSLLRQGLCHERTHYWVLFSIFWAIWISQTYFLIQSIYTFSIVLIKWINIFIEKPITELLAYDITGNQTK